MIVTVKKYLFLGAKEDLDRFFLQIQQKGIVEFIPASGTKAQPLPIEAQNLVDALKVLRKLPLKKTYEGPVHEGYSLEVAKRILEGKASIEKLTEEKRLIEAEIVRIAPFGDFSLEDVDYIEKEGKRELQFFCRKASKRTPELPSGWFLVDSSSELDYYISIAKEAQSYPNMIEMRIDRPLGELQTHLSFVTESLHQLQAELKGFAGHIELLQGTLIEYLNEHHLAVAKKRVSFPIEGTLFSVEAWIPENKTGVLYALLQGMAIHCEPILIETTDRQPTCMENKGVCRIGEDLVKIYDTPAADDKDPSLPVLLFFALFFAMIVADAGYGLLYLAFGLYIRYRYPHIKAAGRRMLKLCFILSSACMIWGVLTSSFFGIEINPKSWVSKLSLVDSLATKKAEYHFHVKDAVYKDWLREFPPIVHATSGEEMLDQVKIEEHGSTIYPMRDTFSENILMELSLLFGVIHISYSFLRYLKRHFAGIGWVLFLIGGYLYFPTPLRATSLVQFLDLADLQTAATVGLQFIYSGLVLALILSIVQQKLMGIIETAHILMQVFGDVLSYLRLYALGLAGTMMAETFNKMAFSVSSSFGFALGCLVILLGHGINISLGIMAGVIHGLRLNFIEWYHYSFKGGGKLFNPLARLHSKEH